LGYDKAGETIAGEIIDNSAIGIICYAPECTLVKKLQTIAARFRNEQEDGQPRPNTIRQYSDVYCLLKNDTIQAFIGTTDYQTHKAKRFPAADYEIPLLKNQAFLLSSPGLRKTYQKQYEATAALYYNGQPPFEEVLALIHANLENL